MPLRADPIMSDHVKLFIPGPVEVRKDILDAQAAWMIGHRGKPFETLFARIQDGLRKVFFTSGRVLVEGRDIHAVRYRERDRLAIHYHQSYQVRSFHKRKPAFLMERAGRTRPLVHLFDEPQFSVQDGYIGFMLEFFRALRREGNVVFLCMHPNEPFHLEILREACERFIFVRQGRITLFPSFDRLVADPDVRAYLGALAPAV